MPSSPVSPWPAWPRGLKVLVLISSVFLVLLVHLHLPTYAPSSKLSWINRDSLARHSSLASPSGDVTGLGTKPAYPAGLVDNPMFLSTKRASTMLGDTAEGEAGGLPNDQQPLPTLRTENPDRIGDERDDDVKALLGGCRLETLAELLPGFQPKLEVTTWLWGSLDGLKGRGLPFGIQNAQDQIAKLASTRSKSSNRLWSPPYNETNSSCDPKPTKNCVVVGNSYALLHSNLGRQIDAHDVVMRFNTAPTTPKYAPDVGTKTTVRFFYPESAELVAKESALLSTRVGRKNKLSPALADYYMMTFYKPNDVDWLLLAHSSQSDEEKTDVFKKLHFWQEVPSPEEITPILNRIRLINPDLLHEAKTLAHLEGIPTSGLYAIVLALHECSLPVSIAGFAYTNNPQDPMHYYDKRLTGDILDPKNPGKHGIGAERAFIDNLISSRVVKDIMKK